MVKKSSNKLNVGILGASGFVGAELLRFLAGHSQFKVTYIGAGKSAGQTLAEVYPQLAIHYPNLKFESLDAVPENLDVAFLALPHGEACQHVGKLQNTKSKIIDLTADFRLPPDEYEKVYGVKNPVPELQPEFAVGIPEFYGSSLTPKTKAVSVPGCYTTATVLALKPLVDAGIATTPLIVDAVSGVSGAGKSLSETTTFNNVDENFFAYKIGEHRHVPEMEQFLGTGEGGVCFTPHLAPMNRGILATCYGTASGISSKDLLGAYQKAYADAPFIHILENQSPATKDVLGTNAAHISASYQEKTGLFVALCAIDNLGKGAAGQAIQCANLICGIDEGEGLNSIGLVP